MDDRFWVNNQLLRDAEIVVVHAQWSKCAKKRPKVRKDTQSGPMLHIDLKYGENTF